MTQTLAFYEPGHFHAALTLRISNPRISNDVHVGKSYTYAIRIEETPLILLFIRTCLLHTHAPSAFNVLGFCRCCVEAAGLSWFVVHWSRYMLRLGPTERNSLG